LCSPCAVLKTPWKGEDKLRPYESRGIIHQRANTRFAPTLPRHAGSASLKNRNQFP
jgi:hypothetical protein